MERTQLGNSAQVLTSIVIVSYNSQHHLDRCLTSIDRTVDSTCETIVVDNASTDGSANYVAERYPWVRLIRSAENEGFAAGNNRGAAAARGGFIVALNPDTEVTPGWLDALLDPLRCASAGDAEAQLPIGLTTPRILMMNERGTVNTCGNLPHYTGITSCWGLGQPAESPELALRCPVPAISGACFALSRVLWHKLGGFDEDFFTYLEDTDLSLRAYLLGYRCLYVPEAVIFHSYTNQFSARKLYFLERNRTNMLLKLYTWRTLALMAPALLLAECVSWGYALKSGRSYMRAKLGAYASVAARCGSIMRRRRQVQLTRQVSDRELLRILGLRLDFVQLAGAAVGRVAGGSLNPLFAVWNRVVRTFVG
jgi:GT2 family glycosyltransferase